MRRLMVLFIFLIASFGLLFSCSHARPPKPGPNFVWVTPHKKPNGVFVPGHWNFTGPKKPHKVWVPAHRTCTGKLIPGHWKPLNQAKPKSVWIPGHFGPRGKWIPGHWK